MTSKIFKEPGGGRRAWVFLLITSYFFIETIFFRNGLFERLAYLTFGTAVLGFALAEILPRDRTRLAGALRIGGVVLMVLTIAVRTVQLTAFAG